MTRLRGIPVWTLLTVVFPITLIGCGSEIILNNIASLGGDQPGDRGTVRITFINNTPYRAIFTFGVLDPQDQFTVPNYEQFYVDPTEDENDLNRGLAGNQSSIIFPFPCGRRISLGGELLISRIRGSGADRFGTGTPAEEVALRTGIAFSDVPLDDPDANAPTAGLIDEVTTPQGVEFLCDSPLVVYTFELDEESPQGIRVDLDVILAEDQ
jgi:hypothetical protein